MKDPFTSIELLKMAGGALLPVVIGWSVASRHKVTFHKGGRIERHPFNPALTSILFVLMLLCAAPVAYYLRHGISRDWGGVGEFVILLTAGILTLGFFGAWLRRVVG